MNLESILKFFVPKGMHISDSGRATASEQLQSVKIIGHLSRNILRVAKPPRPDVAIQLEAILRKLGDQVF